MNMQKLTSTRLLIPILVGSLGGNAWFIYHIQTSPRQVQVRQEIPSQTGTSDAKLSPNPSILNSHQQNQARVSMTADVDEAENDVLEEDLAAKLLTENEFEKELITGLIDSGYTKDQIATIMYDPGSLPQPDSESGLETLTPEEWASEDKLAEGLRADGLSDWQIDSILHDPESLSQPDDQIPFTPTPEQRARLENAGL